MCNRLYALSATYVLLSAVVVAAADPLLVYDDFEHGFARWTTTDPEPASGVWRIERQAGSNHVLRVTGRSEYIPPYRSPHSIALLRDLQVGDFVLTAKVQSTSVSAGDHRDLCLFWCYQDPSHYYYAHLGARADERACQIFIVNGRPRQMITLGRAERTPWTGGWHDVKVVRRVADGGMEVYFDNMENPYMTARDRTFLWGQIGLGSFDDHGNFDDVRLRGRLIAPGHRFTPRQRD